MTVTIITAICMHSGRAAFVVSSACGACKGAVAGDMAVALEDLRPCSGETGLY